MSPPRPARVRRPPLRGRAALTLVFGLSTLATLPSPAWSWGYSVHRLINRNAVTNLPPEFSAFGQWTADLEALATEADERKCCVPGENIRHYIDIDDYPEFFSGAFPRDYDDALSRYGLSRIESNGIGPWALEESYDQLVSFFVAGDWSGAVAAAADIGHYAADLHQPLHLTTNFDGQETGQNGIHSRFESLLTGRHMEAFTPFPGPAPHLENPLGRTFEWIDATWPGVAVILAADRVARTEAGGSTSSEAYYDSMWEQLSQDAGFWIGDASRDIASLWYTAWVEAGSPALPGSIPVESTTWSSIKTLLR
jgi:hypothetical protein